MKRIVGFLLCVVLLFSLCGCNSQEDYDYKYNKAKSLYKSGDYDAAKVIFDELGDYKDSAYMSQRCKLNMAEKIYKEYEDLIRSLP